MENSISNKYNFADFTTVHYRELIRLAKNKYKFSRYHELDKKSKFVLWRHDIDFSIQRSLRLAQIENEEGVLSTFFLHLHSEFYNLFEKAIFDSVKKIIALGHDIGIHFDSHFYNVQNDAEIEKHLAKEKNILENMFEIKIHSFSFHNTNAFVMSCQKWEYAGLINTYAEYFQKEVTYCSDSNGYWRFRRMYDVIDDREVQRLQLLTHPEWWQEDIMSPWEKINRAIDGRSENNKSYYKNLLKHAGMKNIDKGGIL